ncbi:hypothetical protein [Mucilaginibacter sp.]|jgi:hypothetical protein|uniref:hypothetical protein n=1 Tax=Mucilaginibacter sp. TaxID=1882438 RepID=UPI002BF650C7|nr:hypothetical protein [Mucilaginibacter sp.]HTI57421.1 hypothetical protein [Mucilaginibacter sp.]
MKRSYLYLVAVILLSQSCSTVNIASNKKADYNKQPKKIYIVADCNKDAGTFCKNFTEGLKNNLSLKGITCDAYVRNQLSFESEEDINKKIAAYNPEAALMIHQTQTGGGANTFEFTLIDKDTQKPVWKCELEVSIDSYTSMENDNVINKAIKTVLEKLAQDKIIPGGV